MIRLKLKIVGRVQGVGFRYFVMSEAERRGLTGWVMNSSDYNLVEAEAQGEKGLINDFLDSLKYGNSFSKVSKIEKEEIQVVENENKFSILN